MVRLLTAKHNERHASFRRGSGSQVFEIVACSVLAMSHQLRRHQRDDVAVQRQGGQRRWLQYSCSYGNAPRIMSLK